MLAAVVAVALAMGGGAAAASTAAGGEQALPTRSCPTSGSCPPPQTVVLARKSVVAPRAETVLVVAVVRVRASATAGVDVGVIGALGTGRLSGIERTVRPGASALISYPVLARLPPGRHVLSLAASTTAPNGTEVTVTGAWLVVTTGGSRDGPADLP